MDTLLNKNHTKMISSLEESKASPFEILTPSLFSVTYTDDISVLKNDSTLSLGIVRPYSKEGTLILNKLYLIN